MHGIEQALYLSQERLVAANEDRDKYFYKLDGNTAHRLKSMIEKLYAEGTHSNTVN